MRISLFSFSNYINNNFVGTLHLKKKKKDNFFIYFYELPVKRSIII